MMKKEIFLVLLFIIFLNAKINAQIQISTKAIVSGVVYDVVGDKVYIKYDIINAKRSDLFNVSVKAFNSSHNEVLITSVTGDINNVSPGINKSIIWHIGKDIFEIDDFVYIEVYAEFLNPKILQPIKKWEAALYSTLYPGYGTYRLSAKKIHIFKGLVSYGLVAASIYNYKQAEGYYDDYLSSINSNDRDLFFNKSNDKQRLANAYAIGAASLWLIEYVNIYFAENKVLNGNVELGLQIDNLSNTTLLSLNLKF